MYIKAASEVKWTTPPTGYYYSDVKEKILWSDSKTGAMVVLMKWPVGLLDKKHSHPHANQWDFFIKGNIKEGDGEAADATHELGYVPKGERHGGTVVEEECLVLFHWDGPRDPEVLS